jgi:hypothetical protein
MSIGETYVTVQGWVGSEPDFKEIGGQTARATFRIGSTPRQYDRTRGTTTFTKNPPRPSTASATDGEATASETAGALTAVPSSGPAEATSSPYPPDEYATAPIPLTPTTRESEAA